jgi:hypothetical protein
MITTKEILSKSELSEMDVEVLEARLLGGEPIAFDTSGYAISEKMQQRQEKKLDAVLRRMGSGKRGPGLSRRDEFIIRNSFTIRLAYFIDDGDYTQSNWLPVYTAETKTISMDYYFNSNGKITVIG